MSCAKLCVPKKFLCVLSLEIGAFIVGVIMSIVTLVCIIATSVQLHYLELCRHCTQNTNRNAYSFNVVAVVYSIFMFLTCLWYIWGALKKKPSVMLGWLVVSTMWLAQTFCLLVVLIYLYSRHVDFVAWLFTLIFGLIAIGGLAYGLLVVLGYWYELKDNKANAAS